jgi:hypothetical protein
VDWRDHCFLHRSQALPIKGPLVHTEAQVAQCYRPSCLNLRPQADLSVETIVNMPLQLIKLCVRRVFRLSQRFHIGDLGLDTDGGLLRVSRYYDLEH